MLMAGCIASYVYPKDPPAHVDWTVSAGPTAIAQAGGCTAGLAGGVYLAVFDKATGVALTNGAGGTWESVGSMCLSACYNTRTSIVGSSEFTKAGAYLFKVYILCNGSTNGPQGGDAVAVSSSVNIKPGESSRISMVTN